MARANRVQFLCPRRYYCQHAVHGAAFEGWCLALRRWCRVEVVLQWTPPSEDATPSQLRHYERFLYRAARFQSLFDWFRIEARHEIEVNMARSLERRPLLLNVGGARGLEQESASVGDSESALEHRLLSSSEFAAHYGFAHGTRDRQIPVGLFSEKIGRESQIFPGGKGAIDLVCLNAETIWLFELRGWRKHPGWDCHRVVLLYVPHPGCTSRRPIHVRPSPLRGPYPA